MQKSIRQWEWHTLQNWGTDRKGKQYERILVWPVNVSKSVNGAVIAQEKIKTYRIASINADTEGEYTIGSFDGTAFNKSLNPIVGQSWTSRILSEIRSGI